MERIADCFSDATDLVNFWKCDLIIADLQDLGFKLPMEVFKFIEGLRERPAHEKVYAEYLSHVAYESLFVRRGFWSIDTRKAISPKLRSPYLDALQSSRDSGDPEFAVPERFGLYSLDPNEIEYERLGFKDLVLWDEFLAAIKKRKAEEAQLMGGQIREFSAKNSGVTDRSAKAFLKRACIAFQLELEERKEDGETIILAKRSIGNGLAIALIWRELTLLKRTGRFLLGCRIEHTGITRGRAEVLLTKRLDQLVPGGDFYAWGHSEWDTAALGLLFGLNVVELIAQRVVSQGWAVGPS